MRNLFKKKLRLEDTNPIIIITRDKIEAELIRLYPKAFSLAIRMIEHFYLPKVLACVRLSDKNFWKVGLFIFKG